jgi:hypothetical protein
LITAVEVVDASAGDGKSLLGFLVLQRQVVR